MLGGRDAGVDQRLEVIRLDGEDPLEVAGGPLEIAGREKGLGQVEAELDVPLSSRDSSSSSRTPAVGVQGEDGELGLAQPPEKILAVFSGEARDDPVAPLQKAVLLLHRLHPVVHLGLPEVQDLLGADGAAPLEGLLQGQDPRVGDEEILLEIPQGFEEGLDRLPRALDHVLERRDPLEQMLVEGNLLRVSPPSSTTPTPESTRSLELTAGAELLFVGVLQAADLAVHVAGRASRGRRHGQYS